MNCRFILMVFCVRGVVAETNVSLVFIFSG